MRYLVILLCFFCLPLAGQSTNAEGKEVWSSLELSGGINVPTYRKLLRDRERADGLNTGVGGYLGVAMTLDPYGSLTGVFGVDYMYERGELRGYQRDNRSGVILDSGQFNEAVTGVVQFSEQFLRMRLEPRVNIKKYWIGFGLHASVLVASSNLRYDFTQTTTSIQDAITGTDVELSQPIVTTGSQDLERDPLLYFGLLPSVGYAVTPICGRSSLMISAFTLRGASIICGNHGTG